VDSSYYTTTRFGRLYDYHCGGVRLTGALYQTIDSQLLQAVLFWDPHVTSCTCGKVYLKPKRDFELHAAIARCGLVSAAMAHCVRRPLAYVFQKTPTCTFQARHFSQGPVRHAAHKAAVSRLERRTPNQRSLKVAMKEKMEMPTDLGLLAGKAQSPRVVPSAEC